MARIRTIKPEFWSSGQILECSKNARLLFLGLWNFCDDAGRHPYRPKQIKAEVFPGDDDTENDILALLKELQKNGLIEVYTVETQRFLRVTGWHHQRIDKPQDPRYPGPDQGTVDDHSKNDPGTFPPDRKGKEGIGKEGSRKNSQREARDDTFEEFWRTYPHPANRGSKRKARDRWRTRVKDPPAVLRGVGHYAAYCAAESHWYSPKMAEGWLNGETWENWQEPPKNGNTRTIDADRIDAIVNGSDPDAGHTPCRDLRPALERPGDAGENGGIRAPPAPFQRK